MFFYKYFPFAPPPLQYYTVIANYYLTPTDVENSLEELQEMIDQLVEAERRYGMEINVKKIKAVVISRVKRDVENVVDDKELKQVDHFKYLGSMQTSNGDCVHRIRIEQGEVALKKKRTLLTRKLKKTLVKC